MSAVFQVDPSEGFVEQCDLMAHYKEDKAGLCNGLILEYARHHFVHKLKGTPSNFNKKFKDNIKNPSANFLDRVEAYQKYYQVEAEHVIYRTDRELDKLFDNPKFENAEVLEISFYEIEGKMEHAIAVKIERSGNETVYKVFDPELGESITYHSKEDCLSVLNNLKLIYLKLLGCKNLSIAAKDLAPVLNEIGIIPGDGSHTKDSKYAYEIVKAIEEKDLTKIHGELGSKIKLDCITMYSFDDKKKYIDDAFIPHNPMDLAILRLDEADLAKLINNNTQLDLTKSLTSIVWKLLVVDKGTPAVLDALIAKLPPDGSDEYRQSLEMIKKNASEPYTEDDSTIIVIDATPANKLMFEKLVEETNSHMNFRLSLHRDMDINHKHFYIIESVQSVVNFQLPLNTDGDLYTTNLECSIELHTDSTYMEELNSFD